MSENQKKFLVGKLKHKFLNQMLEKFVSTTHLKDSKILNYALKLKNT